MFEVKDIKGKTLDTFYNSLDAINYCKINPRASKIVENGRLIWQNPAPVNT
jgi:hypothetical protein